MKRRACHGTRWPLADRHIRHSRCACVGGRTVGGSIRAGRPVFIDITIHRDNWRFCHNGSSPAFKLRHHGGTEAGDDGMEIKGRIRQL
jgi:hypothetical protein